MEGSYLYHSQFNVAQSRDISSCDIYILGLNVLNGGQYTPHKGKVFRTSPNAKHWQQFRFQTTLKNYSVYSLMKSSSLAGLHTQHNRQESSSKASRKLGRLRSLHSEFHTNSILKSLSSKQRRELVTDTIPANIILAAPEQHGSILAAPEQHDRILEAPQQHDSILSAPQQHCTDLKKVKGLCSVTDVLQWARECGLTNQYSDDLNLTERLHPESDHLVHTVTRIMPHRSHSDPTPLLRMSSVSSRTLTPPGRWRSPSFDAPEEVFDLERIDSLATRGRQKTRSLHTTSPVSIRSSSLSDLDSLHDHHSVDEDKSLLHSRKCFGDEDTNSPEQLMSESAVDMDKILTKTQQIGLNQSISRTKSTGVCSQLLSSLLEAPQPGVTHNPARKHGSAETPISTASSEKRAIPTASELQEASVKAGAPIRYFSHFSDVLRSVVKDSCNLSTVVSDIPERSKTDSVEDCEHHIPAKSLEPNEVKIRREPTKLPAIGHCWDSSKLGRRRGNLKGNTRKKKNRNFLPQIQLSTDINEARIIASKVKGFHGPPRPKPKTVIAHYPSAWDPLTHWQIFQAVKKTLHYAGSGEALAVCYEPSNVILGTSGLSDRWIIDLDKEATADYVVQHGLWIQEQYIFVEPYDRVVELDFQRFQRLQIIRQKAAQEVAAGHATASFRQS